MGIDYYYILGLKRTCSKLEILQAWVIYIQQLIYLLFVKKSKTNISIILLSIHSKYLSNINIITLLRSE